MQKVFAGKGKLTVAKTQRSKRALALREPKIVENVKKSFNLKGPSTSQIITKVLKDLHKLKAPNSKMLQKRNLTRPFEDAASVEFLSQVNDASLFAYGSHSKKRPHNLVLGRLFDYQILDMFEFGVDEQSFKDMQKFEGIRKATIRYDSKPMFLFNGVFDDEDNEEIQALKSLILDYFRGEVVPKINLAALDRVIVVTALDSKRIYFRHYGIALKSSGTRFPRVELDECGPSMNLTVRRSKLAAPDMKKEAMRKPGPAKSKYKNKEKGAFGQTVGRLHVHKQKIGQMALSKLKGLKKRKAAPEAPELGDTDKAQGGRKLAKRAKGAVEAGDQ